MVAMEIAVITSHNSLEWQVAQAMSPERTPKLKIQRKEDVTKLQCYPDK